MGSMHFGRFVYYRFICLFGSSHVVCVGVDAGNMFATGGKVCYGVCLFN